MRARIVSITETIAFLALLASCQGDADNREPRAQGLSVRDSIRLRREARLASMPDTLGGRVDSARVAGSPDAKVWIVVTSDFQCEPCRAFAVDVLPTIRREFVDAGVARLAFINAPRDQHFNARFAAHSALCAASANRFWPMHDSLFATQPRWARMDEPRPFMDSLAVLVGVPIEVQQSCTRRQPLLRLLGEDLERGRLSAVTDVPTVFVGDVRLTGGELTVSRLRLEIAKASR